ncbi:hypothetical protein O181_002048 [Austropuccinia psidii MF-1]|uniref:Uncharacterized protein n=1 Tax=Austropuccinia psidii MF-1 TaxID=1389203 RepID=A0A9Q3BBP9_9BASI|nr:hypothetical protein [Austropuccinia psidii MF-1]
MITINNIMSVFIYEIASLKSGIIINTPKYPEGNKVVVRLGRLLGDLVANHKFSGFASHSSTCFCSWCACPKANIQKLTIGRLLQMWIFKDYSQAFNDLKNEAERARMVKKSGIKWSGLNRLCYWDPVHMIPIGIMHN